MDADPRRGRARRRDALQQSAPRPDPGHGWIDGDGEFVRAAAQSRRGCSRDAGQRGSEAVERARRLDRGEARGAHACERQEGHLRRAGGCRCGGARSRRAQAQGSEGFHLHRQARPAHRLARQVEWQREIHAGRSAAGNADGARRALAEIRRNGRVVRCGGRKEDSRRALCGRAQERGGRPRDQLLERQDGQRRAQDRVGRLGCIQGIVRSAHGRLQGARVCAGDRRTQ